VGEVYGRRDGYVFHVLSVEVSAGGLMIQMLVWLLPASRFKNRLLRGLGHKVAPSALIGPNLLYGVRCVKIGECARVGPFNVFRGLSQLILEDYAIISSWNWISAHPGFQTVDHDAGTLFMGYAAKIGSRNYLDCSGTVIAREYSHLGGNRCFVQSHAPDYANATVTVGRVTIGHHAMVGSCAVMLKGANLPDQSLLASNSTMLRSSAADGKRGLYAGSPAKWRRETIGRYFDTDDAYDLDNWVVDEPMGILAADVSVRDKAIASET